MDLIHVRYPWWVALVIFAVIIIVMLIMPKNGNGSGSDTFDTTQNKKPQEYVVWPDCADKTCEICEISKSRRHFATGSFKPIFFPHGFTCTVAPPAPET
uniref:Transmembrane protein n=1 Tax=Marseillevirus LCMAC202 TaxID=2506606 RepID=A0A481YYA4_9VIRU|nr:MAG: hypothetical protein LCMAC202_01310 [Marseillevirus LCMAC202]